MESSPDHCTTLDGEAILTLIDVEQLELLDTSLSRFLEESFDRWCEKICSTNPSLPLPLAFGTALEGGWSTKFVSSSNGPHTLNINILQPFVFLKTLSEADYKQRVVDIGKPGFVNLRLLSVDLADSQSLRELAVMDAEDGEWYLSPKLTVELSAYHAHIAKKLPFYFHINEPKNFLETIIQNVYGTGKKEVTGDAFDLETWEDDPVVKTKIETLPCLECSGWPEIAAKWPRETEWPEKEVSVMVKRAGFHLVRSGVDPTELPLSWRLSFTRAENLLMKTWNVHQRRCYLALRAFCINNLSARGGLGPYILKTIMLWDSEEHPPEAKIWEISTGICMDRLLMKLRSVIEHGTCDHYFIKGLNIIENMTIPIRKSLLKSFDNGLDSIENLKGVISFAGLEKVSALVDWYANRVGELHQSGQEECEKKEDRDAQVPGDACVSSIFTDQLLESTYDTYVRVNMSTSKQDKARAARCRSKFFNTLVALYIMALAVVYGLTTFSPHASLMVFLVFLVAGLLLNLGWSYRWCLCFIYSVVSLESEWSRSWKVVHFILAFPLAKLIAQMMGMFERPLVQQRTHKVANPPPFPLTGSSVAKPGLVAPMLFLYGVNLLLMCASRAYGLRNFWDVFVCTLANQGHFMVFCPWMELFYNEYNQLLVRLKPAICATVCTSLFVMFMLHFSDYNKAFWPWFSMTLLVTGLCASMCYALPTNLAIIVCVLFSVLILLPARILYVVMVVLYTAHWIPLSWQLSPISRAIQVLTMLCVHLCLQTTSLTAILASVNMVFGCCMYVGCLYSFYTAETSHAPTSLLHRISSRLMVLIFVGGVALLTLQSKPVSTQEAFIMVSAPVAAAMLLHSLEGTVLHTLVKLWKRAWAQDGGVANHA